MIEDMLGKSREGVRTESLELAGGFGSVGQRGELRFSSLWEGVRFLLLRLRSPTRGTFKRRSLRGTGSFGLPRVASMFTIVDAGNRIAWAAREKKPLTNSTTREESSHFTMTEAGVYLHGHSFLGDSSLMAFLKPQARCRRMFGSVHFSGSAANDSPAFDEVVKRIGLREYFPRYCTKPPCFFTSDFPCGCGWSKT